MRKYIFFFLSFVFIFVPTAQVLAYSKEQVGLNAHWALGGFGQDSKYEKRLDESRTKWVREHFYHEVLMGPDRGAWLSRYDQTMNNYRDLGISVVGMLAYGTEHGDFSPPNEEEWKNYVRSTVKRYQYYVRVWEVWNEPDSPDFLQPNNPEHYVPLLKSAYEVIKEVDPQAVVLTGGLSQLNRSWVERLYTDADGSFDGIAMHIYTCRESNHDLLQRQLSEVDAVIQAHNPSEQVWITEAGCSASYGITTAVALQYNQEMLDIVFTYPWVKKVFLYNIRNRVEVNEYENNFGLLTADMQPLAGWDWYSSILIGPYDKERKSLSLEEERAADLRRRMENSFGAGLIPVSAENWPQFVSAYVYGGYPVQALVQAARFGGKTVHPSIGWDSWKNTDEYKAYIDKNWNEGRLVYAYGEPRQLFDSEVAKSRELQQAIDATYDGRNLGINFDNWPKLVKAYVYGGYPVEAIVRAGLYDFATVSETVKWSEWRNSAEYRGAIGKSVPLKVE